MKAIEESARFASAFQFDIGIGGPTRRVVMTRAVYGRAANIGRKSGTRLAFWAPDLEPIARIRSKHGSRARPSGEALPLTDGGPWRKMLTTRGLGERIRRGILERGVARGRIRLKRGLVRWQHAPSRACASRR